MELEQSPQHSSYAPARYLAWITRDTWMLYECACLLCGLEPPADPHGFKAEDRVNAPEGTDRQRAADMYGRIKRAVDDKSGAMRRSLIPARVQPRERKAYFRMHSLPPAVLIAWARTKRAVDPDFPLPPELDRAYPPVEAVPAPQQPDKAAKAAPKAAAKAPDESPYKRQSPGPDLPRLKSAGLATVFKDVDLKRDWRETTKNSKLNRLCEVTHTEAPPRSGRRGHRYDPEGVALWLMDQPLTGNESKRTDRYKVAAAMIEHIEGLRRGLNGDDLAEKLEYWEGIQSD